MRIALYILGLLCGIWLSCYLSGCKSVLYKYEKDGVTWEKTIKPTKDWWEVEDRVKK